MFVYRHNCEAPTDPAPEAMQKIHQKWQSWIAEALQKGWMLDAGNGLGAEGCVVNAKKIVSDGPFIEAKEIVGGYALVQADSLPAAAELAKGCPILQQGSSVEVRPFWA
jgi:hypothetical protein